MESCVTKHKIISALESMCIQSQVSPQNSEKIRLELHEHSMKIGFSLALLDISNDTSIKRQIRRQAIFELQNLFKKKKSKYLNQWDPLQVYTVVYELIGSIQSWDETLLKQYKNIFSSLIWRIEGECHIFAKQLIQMMMKEGAITKTIFEVLLVFVEHFEYAMSDQQKEYSDKVTEAIFPALEKLIKINPDPKYIYYSVKILCKSIHLELNTIKRSILMRWMPFLQKIIEQQNQLFNENPSEVQEQHTEEFYYFHSKKWALKILSRTYQKHTTPFDQNNNDFGKRWFQSFGLQLINIVIGQLTATSNNTIRNLQLKTIMNCLRNRTKQVMKYADILQFDKLLPCMKMNPNQVNKAQLDPVKFINQDIQDTPNYNSRCTALNLWADIQKIKNKDVDKMGKNNQLESNSLNFIQQILNNRFDWIKKQMAMGILVVLIQLRDNNLVMFSPKRITHLIQQYIIQDFQSEFLMLRFRAVQICSLYCKRVNKIPLIQTITENMCACLLRDQNPIVKIKAGHGIRQLIDEFPEARKKMRPHILEIANQLLLLMSRFCLQQIPLYLESAVEFFGQQLSALSWKIIKEAKQIYMIYKRKQKAIEKDDESIAEQQFSASACLGLISKTISSCHDLKMFRDLQPLVLELLYDVLIPIDYNFSQEVFDILRAYVQHSEEISKQIWLFYQILISNITRKAINQNKPLCLALLTQQEKQKVNSGVLSSQGSDDIQPVLPVLVSYIRKGALIDKQHTYVAYLLIDLTSKVTQQRSCFFNECLFLLCELVQNYQNKLSENQYKSCYNFAVYIRQYRSNTSTQIIKSTQQLLSLLIWFNPERFIQLSQKDGLFESFIRTIFELRNRYTQQYQRNRILLGLSSLIKFQKLPSHLKNTEISMADELLREAINIATKMAKNRLRKKNKPKRKHKRSVSESSPSSPKGEDCVEQQMEEEIQNQLQSEEIEEMIDQDDQQNSEDHEQQSNDSSEEDDEMLNQYSDDEYGQDSGQNIWRQFYAKESFSEHFPDGLKFFFSTLADLRASRSKEFKSMLQAVDLQEILHLESQLSNKVPKKAMKET